jgi:menaquinone-dependent protoporphyrinogen oxidase
MKVLIAVSSKHGATREIAEAIGRRLTERGLEVEVRDVVDADDVSDFGAVVLGSAVYAGRWLAPARDYVDDHGEELSARPTWLFSSGPIGHPPRPAEGAVDVDAIVERTNPRDHRVFAGKLDPQGLDFAERAIAFAFRADAGDFRDWDAIAAWAGDIADALAQPSSNSPTGA